MPEREQQNNNRTHEPSLREITAELDGFRKLMEERDVRYCERFHSSEKFNSVVAAAADKAISKAETAQDTYNRFHNDLQRKMETDRRDFALAHTVDGKFGDFEKRLDEVKRDIAGLRESRSEGGGKSTQTERLISWLIAFGGLAIAAFAIFYKH